MHWRSVLSIRIWIKFGHFRLIDCPDWLFQRVKEIHQMNKNRIERR